MLRDAALHALVAEGVLSEDDVILAGASTNFAVASLLSSETLTPWTYLFATLLDIDRRQALGISGSPLFTYLQNGQLTMADFLTGTGAAAWQASGAAPTRTSRAGSRTTRARCRSWPPCQRSASGCS